MGGGSREIVWTHAALECVDEILRYMAEEAPNAIENVLGAIDATVESLADLSERGRVVPEIGDATIREVFVFQYRILYQVGDEEVRILGVIHGAMDFAARFRRDRSK